MWTQNPRMIKTLTPVATLDTHTPSNSPRLATNRVCENTITNNSDSGWSVTTSTERKWKAVLVSIKEKNMMPNTQTVKAETLENKIENLETGLTRNGTSVLLLMSLIKVETITPPAASVKKNVNCQTVMERGTTVPEPLWISVRVGTNTVAKSETYIINRTRKRCRNSSSNNR
ncbi:MAG: hypothetical protein FWG02_08280 [Holophagaceae bacterium]|nr:hypothetical protein [Holophagaceae bacterium]